VSRESQGSALNLSRRAPTDHCGFHASVSGHALPPAVVPSAQERDYIRTGVIFPKDLQRLIGPRRSFVNGAVTAFFPGDHGEACKENWCLKQAAICLAEINPTLCAVDIHYFRTVGKSHRYRSGDLQPASTHRVS